MRRLLKPSSSLFAFVAVLLLLIGAGLSVVFWGWLHPTTPTTVSNSETLRNVGLLIGGALAFVFALWRGWVAERQVDIALQSLLNERYERGAEMLGSEVLSVRLAGIYALRRLAEEHPEQYHISIMQLFCAFVRNPTGSQEGQNVKDVSPNQSSLWEDVQAVMTAIGGRGELGLALEKRAKFILDLHGADLSSTLLSGMNLAGADLSRANLRDADFFGIPTPPPDLSEPIPSGPNQPEARFIASELVTPDLSGMDNHRANLSLSILSDADLSGTYLLGADLSGAQLINANLSNSRIVYANLRKAVLCDANLSGAFVLDSDLSGANLGSANLSGARLLGAKIYGANLFLASLLGADFSSAVLSKADGEFRATGLTQEQINQVKVSPNNLPSLTGLVDAVTREPLVWPSSPPANDGQ